MSSTAGSGSTPQDRALRICLVSAAYRPYLSGVSEHVHNLALALKDRGHDVHLLTTSYPAGSGSPAPGPFPVTRLGRALVLPALRGHFTLPFGPGLPAGVRRFFDRHRFDIVHCHGIFPPDISYWACRYARASVVVTFHSVVPNLPRFLQSGFRLLFPELSRKPSARVAVSKAAATWASAWFPADYRIIPNGVRTDLFQPAAPPAGAPTILYISRLDRRKGLPVLLRSLLAVCRDVPGTRLVVVGSGPLEASCRRLCRRLGLEQQVEFRGPVRPDDLPGLYAGCTVFAAPALGPESMGIILLEAMACGRPVVASDIPGYDEVIADGENGVLVPPGNPEEMARALTRILKSADMRQALAHAARNRAADFAWTEVAARVESVYRESLA